jgi:hypothetical protein
MTGWNVLKRNWLAIFLIILGIALFLLFSGYLTG